MAQQSTDGRAFVTPIGTPNAKEINIKDPDDLAPSDTQPSGVDDDEPQSLEEALTG
tara:strand:+ start:124 stop:291 length:168 start_codon:yes stop_codon:yes gene_type:complete